jgi:hypothetical protein
MRLMDVGLQRRIASNQALFREANEAIARGLWPGEEHVPVRFRCECAQVDCRGVVELTVSDYERIRGHPRRFVILDGHELPEVERVVESNGDQIVVEKDGAAGLHAELSDPRS